MDEHQESLFDSPEIRPRSSSTRDDALVLLGLARIKGLGYNGLRRVYEVSTELGRLAEASPDEASRVIGAARLRGGDEVAREWSRDRKRYLSLGRTALERLDRQGVALIFDFEEMFPPALRAIPDSPHWLFVQGDASLLRKAGVAVVGTRKPTRQGVNAARTLAGLLAQWGLVVISGLAEGIDSAAHEVAVDFGAPTVAVLGTGISVVFPAATGGIRERIVEAGGALVTEYLPDDSYSRQRFVMRNRIQAALAIATCPVEAAASSGTAHTLEYAIRFRRRVFGAYSGEYAHSNQMLLGIEQRGKPVFDLSDPSDVADLRAFLESVPGMPPLVEQRGSKDHLFDSLLREFVRLAQRYDASDEDVRRLLDRLSRQWEELGRGKRFDG